MPSFYHFSIDFYAFLIGIVESEFCSMHFESIIVFIRMSSIERISFTSLGDDLDIHSQSCLMLASADLGASEQRASLPDEIILESSAPVSACDPQSIAAERIPEMPCHISELNAGFLSQFERFRIICSEVGVDRK